LTTALLLVPHKGERERKKGHALATPFTVGESRSRRFGVAIGESANLRYCQFRACIAATVKEQVEVTGET